jgi:hypothetical protein
MRLFADAYVCASGGTRPVQWAAKARRSAHSAAYTCAGLPARFWSV